MTQTKLPENFVIKREMKNHLWDGFINWINETYNWDFDGTDGLFYGVVNGEPVVLNTPNFPIIITLEQWSEAVNGKEEFGDINEGDFFECICDLKMSYGTLEYTKGQVYKTEVNGCITDNSGDKQHKWNETTPTAKYFKRITKQPRLKVGDKIPEYLDGKLNFYNGNTLVDGNFSVGEHKVIKIEGGKYNVQIDKDCFTWSLDISQVDALIEEWELSIKIRDMALPNIEFKHKSEEHEREMKETGFQKNLSDDTVVFTAPENINNTPYLQEWIPKNGEEVEVSGHNNCWSPKYRYVGICEDETHAVEFNGELVKWKNVRKPTFKPITKTHSEIAELLGIAKEQLKIVEG